MPKKYPPHKCENPNCENITERKRFCSTTCQAEYIKGTNHRAYLGDTQIICKNCGVIFRVRNSILRNYQRRGIVREFCTTKCKGEYHSKYKTGAANPCFKGNTDHNVCKNCGKSFSYKTYGKYKNQKKQFCTELCKHKYHQIKRECIICGKEFVVKKSAVERGRGIVCSNKCASLLQIGRFIGDKSPVWKGGTSFEPYCPKFNKEFKERVRAFFNYKCAECGMSQEENGKALGVHHVIYNKNTCCDSTIPLFVPLCNHCHSKTNSRRKHWQTHFTELINTKYGGKCYYTKEEWASLNGEPSPAAQHQRCTGPSPAAVR